jgi:rhodanese-related sulfurtransferase/rubrerythrin
MDYIFFVVQHSFGGSMPQESVPPKDIGAEEARKMLSMAVPNALTVLDVRQGWEYEELHLPGAKLMPLGELEDRTAEIPRDKPLLVYCRSGKRSAAAASLLSARGYKDVTNMLGGITAWSGASAVGPQDSGMRYWQGDETPERILALAFAMERELGVFYQELADSAADPELKATFARLAGFEDKHKLVVYHLYKTLFPQSAGIEDLADKATFKALEGGRSADEVLADSQGFESSRDALDMAMGIEAQALDLYMRYAERASDAKTRETLHELAKEERGHLRALATMMDRLGPG